MALILFNVQLFSTRTSHLHMYMAQFLFPPCSPLLPFAPLAPHCSPFTYLAPSSCDRNRPPPSQVNYKLTPFAPSFTHCPAPPCSPEPQLPNAWKRRPWDQSALAMRNKYSLLGCRLLWNVLYTTVLHSVSCTILRRCVLCPLAFSLLYCRGYLWLLPRWTILRCQPSA
jgi:hypothetical protein